MNRRIPILIISLVLAPGCVVHIGSTSPKTQREVITTKEVVVVPAGTEESANLAEIDAAAQLSFDPTRSGALKKVAQRPNLSPTVQVHLVNVTFKRVDFEPNKVDILQALISNPSFASAAKEAILKQLNTLAFEPHKASLLDAIQRRAEAN
jgi:hypothetical protein